MIKTNLSKTDQKMFQEFKKRYPGWDIVRYEDGTLIHIPPKKD